MPASIELARVELVASVDATRAAARADVPASRKRGSIDAFRRWNIELCVTMLRLGPGRHLEARGNLGRDRNGLHAAHSAAG